MADRSSFSRRRADDPRHPVRIPATIEAAATAGHPQTGRIVDLSRGGLALRFFGALDPGAPVRVTLHLRHRAPLLCVGRVAWVDRAFQPGDGSVGVAFRDDLDGALVAAIAAEESRSDGQVGDGGRQP